ncbi:MAG: thioredoxin-like domain-containing protein [Alphaproteobacteria bacterium]
MMHRILVLLAFVLLSVAPARAADNYAMLFNDKQMWLNTARPVTVDDAKGRAVLLDFWTYGCINCMQVVPDLKALEAEFGDSLLVIGVHSAKFAGERDGSRILAAAKRFGVTHPVINDSAFRVWDSFRVEAWPTLILLGPDGTEVDRYAGEGHKDEIQSDIKGVLTKTSKAASSLSSLKMKDGEKTTLSFPARLGFAPDTPWGEVIFVADAGHNRLLGFDINGNIKVTIGSGAEGAEDGDFAKASFHNPRGFAVAKNALYVADTDNHMIRRVDFASKTVTRVAGTGERGTDRDVTNADGLKTAIASPWDAKMLADNKTLVIAMAGLHQLWTLDTEKNTVSVLAGTGAESIEDGKAADATLAQPSGISVFHDDIYFADAESSSLRVLTKDGKVKTLIGTGLFDFGIVDGIYPRALLQHAQGLDVQTGRVVLADTYNNALRLYDLTTQELSTIKLPEGTLAEPGDIMHLNGKMFVADTNHHRIAIVDPAKKTVTTLDLK